MTPPAAVAQTQSVIGTTLDNVEVINHLLFHKAIIGDQEDATRLNNYLTLVKSGQPVASVPEGEHVSIRDPFDRSIALAFDLIIHNRFNPWDIDLVRFSTLYLEHARERKLDLVTAGRIILMAWTVLKLQSDDLVRRSEARKEEAQNLEWEDIPDWGLSGPELDFTDRIRMSPRAPLDEKVWHEGDRKVTLMELVDAFESARTEAEQRQLFNEQRDQLRARIKAEGAHRFKGRVHREDLEEDLKVVWGRILGRNGDAINLRQLYDANDPWDFVTTFNGVLFLNRDRKVDVWQEDFPFGPVFVKNLMTGHVEQAPVEVQATTEGGKK